MKLFKINFIFLTLFVFSTTVVYAESWFFQMRYPTEMSLMDVEFVSPQKGWLIGESGTILYTEDGGDTWQLQESGTSEFLKSIFFIDEKTGFVVGTKGTILNTNDGGIRWLPQQSGSIQYDLFKVFFVNRQVGWIIGADISKIGNRGLLLRTQNGGKTWQKLSVEFSHIDGIFFKDQDSGWILADFKIYKTIDGGESWQPINLPMDYEEAYKLPWPRPDASFVMPKGDIYFADNKKGWVLVNTMLSSQIFYTEDGGNTWRSQFSGGKLTYIPPRGYTSGPPGVAILQGSAIFLRSFFFANNMRGCALSDVNIFCTDDDELSWQERLKFEKGKHGQVDSFWIDLANGDFVDDKVGWVVGKDGLIMKTDDGGKSWNIKTIKRLFTTYYFIDNRTGLAFDIKDKDGFVIKTTDGGETWELKMKTECFIRKFCFANRLKGWATGELIKDRNTEETHSCFYSTSDGGETWQLKMETECSLRKLYFTGKEKGWAVGEKKDSLKKEVYGCLYSTKDESETWSLQLKKKMNIPKKYAPAGFSDIWFVNTTKGWIIGGGGIILHTEDGGKTWSIQRSGTGMNLYKVYFVDEKKGWVIGGTGVSLYSDPEEEQGKPEGIILYTEDGGKTWHTQWIRKGVALNDILFLDSEKGFIFGEDCLFLYTENGGKTWLKKELFKNEGMECGLYAPFFIDKKRGWVRLGITEEIGKTIISFLVTEDGGKTWKKIKPKPSKHPWRPFD